MFGLPPQPCAVDGVDHAVDEVQSVHLAVGRNEQLRRLDRPARSRRRACAAGRPTRRRRRRTCRASAPRGPASRSGRRDRGRCRRVRSAAVPGTCCRTSASRSAARWRRRCRRRCRRRRRRSAISLSPDGVLTLPAMSGGKRLCICRGCVVGLHLPQQRHVLDGVFRQDRLVALPGGALRIAAVGQPVGLPLGLCAGQRSSTRPPRTARRPSQKVG